MTIRSLIAVVLLAACTSTHPAATPELFHFHSNFWLNLHHYLRVVGRGAPVNAAITGEEKAAWERAVAVYRETYSQRDLIRDEGMVAIKNALRGAEGRDSLEGIDVPADLRTALETAAPVYRKYMWAGHDAANQSWIANVQPLLSAHGAKIAPKVAAAYGETWPGEPVDVDMAPSAGPDGAYTTSPPVHVTISSVDAPGNRGLASLELMFHETSHQWGRRLAVGLNGAAERRGKTIPRALWHAVLFYNAEEITRRVLADAGVPYAGYGGAGLYRDLCGDGCREKVAAAWDPHLAGTATMDEALDRLVASW
jgi:hypothetical protein